MGEAVTPFEIAMQELGICERPGPKTNLRIAEYHESVGLSVDDEVAWCSSFRNFCEEEANGEGSGTNRPNARSWLKWGNYVDAALARIGDTVVFWRGARDGWKGHVAFFLAWSKDRSRVLVLGGNQSNRVSVQWYSVDKILEFRRA